ncbi:OmpA family protein [Pedobacter sp. ASV12]|uniref:OmpA family protein n=1 Tax=Pedobacter sp. ASV12 TaxID=2795120 RepID=UPI001E63C555|nr:OmpA family protein [Pedobacter sp. ASV12]
MQLKTNNKKYQMMHRGKWLFLGLLAMGLQTKAQYVLLKADEEFRLFHYSTAIGLYTEAYQKKPTTHAIERLAACYRLTKDYPQAESWYAMLVKEKGAKPEAFLYYGDALRNNSKYAEAKIQYQKYGELNRDLPATQKSMLVLSCDSALSWMKSPKSLVLNNKKNINSVSEDWGAVTYQGGIVFTSDRRNALVQEEVKKNRPFLKFDEANIAPDKVTYGWTGNNYLRLYVQKGTDSATLFPFNAGSEYHVGAATFTADGNEMYFTLTRIPELIEREKGVPKTVRVEIYSSKKDANGKWGAVQPFKYNNVNEYSVGDPFISKDGGALYFVSDMPGGKGLTDIYVCFRTEGGGWGKAINLEEINTEGSERSPFFDDDSNFYFSTDGRIGMGGLDVFKAAKRGNGLAEPKNMGYPLNSPQDDFAFFLTGKKEGLLSSDRVGGNGSDDIYSFILNPNLSFKLEGVALDKKTGLPLPGVIVSLSKADGTIISAQTDDQGRYKFNLEENTEYFIKGTKTDFRNAETETISNVGIEKSAVFKKNIYLDPIELFKEIKLENIYYDFDKSNIRKDAAIELDKLVKIMKENPTIWIELGSHTDSRGNDKYNMKLSQARADAAVSYIISRGIDKVRIKAKGYGETRLLNQCANGVECTEEQHQLNRRTEFTIVKQ